MKVRRVPSRLLLLLVAVQQHAAETVIFDNGSFSVIREEITGHAQADDFTFTLTQTFNQVRFWAIDHDNDPAQLDNFSGGLSWFVYANDVNKPGAVVASGNVASAISVLDTGSQLNIAADSDDPELLGNVFELVFPTVNTTLNPGTYWFRIKENGVAVPDDGSPVQWMTTAINPLVSHLTDNNVLNPLAWTGAHGSRDLAFQLLFVPVPEATSLAAIGLSGATIAGACWRRRPARLGPRGSLRIPDPSWNESISKRGSLEMKSRRKTMITTEPTSPNSAPARTRPAGSNDRRRFYNLARVAVLLGAALYATAISAFATEPVPVQGDAAGIVSVIPTGNNASLFTIHFAGAGTLTNIGPFEFVLDCLATVDSFGKPSPVPGTTGTITTPNGDKIFFTLSWLATRDGDQIHATGHVTAHAGTGRFAQANVSGEFITEANLGTRQMSLTFTGTIAQAALVRADAGVDGPAIQAAIDQFRADLGPRREINWDGVPDNLAAPNFLPGDFFNLRGAFFSTPGAGVQVSADSSNPTGTSVRFGNINPTYPDIFKTFSAERLFSPIGSAIVDLTFVVPGTDIPALVKGFGAVYADADMLDATSFQYFDVLGNSLGNFSSPASNKGLSFLGVSFDSPVVRRVRIVYGNSALGPDDGNGTDVAVMDDFIYGEPQGIIETSIRVSQVEVCWNSTSNLTYQVQYRSDLTANLWTSLVECVRSTGSRSCIFDPVIVGQPQRFYRVFRTNCVPPL